MNSITRVLKTRLAGWIKWPSATVEYPYVSRGFVQNARVSLRNNFSECIGCHDCEKACPVGSIAIQSEDFPNKERTPKTSKGVIFEKRVTSFKIDYRSCVNCGICTEVCPTQSLTNDRAIIEPKARMDLLEVDLVHRPRALRRETGHEE